MRSTARSAPAGRERPEDRRPAVLLTNAEERSVLAACRSLSEAGYRVAAASHTALAPAQWSRACEDRVRVPDPRRDARGFVEGLRAELARRPYAVLMPGSDGALLAISRERERLPAAAATGLPPHAVVQRALSRAQLDKAARAAGFTDVAGIICGGLHEALVAARELGYPIALKSAETAYADVDADAYGDGDGDGDARTETSVDANRAHAAAVSGAAKGRLVRDEAELRREAPDFRGALLVQRFLAGDPVSFAGVIAGGQLLAVAVSRYIRMWPPDGGSVAFGETIASAPELEERVSRLLTALGWEGIFELELIRTTDGEFVPIDLNPRPYGSMALADAAGAPLAAVWCDWLLGRAASAAGRPPSARAVQPGRAHGTDPPLPGAPDGNRPLRARPGVRYRWEDGDLRYLVWQLRRGNARAALVAARPRSGVVHAHLQGRDPLPLLARGLYLAKRAGAGARQ